MFDMLKCTFSCNLDLVNFIVIQYTVGVQRTKFCCKQLGAAQN